MNIPSALLDCLKSNQIDYEILPHAEAFTARMAAAAEDIPRHHQAKVVMVSCQEGPPYDGASRRPSTRPAKAREVYPRAGGLAKRGGVRVVLSGLRSWCDAALWQSLWLTDFT